MMEDQVQKVSRKERLLPGWEPHVSKSYPHKVYYYNRNTNESVWKPPICTEKSSKRTLSPKKNSSSACKKGSSQMSKNPDSSSEEKPCLKKRKGEPYSSSSPKKINKAKLIFKINSARSPVKPPSPSIRCSDNLKVHEQKRSLQRTGDAAGVKEKVVQEKVTCYTKTAVVDPIIRKSSTLSDNIGDRLQKGSVFSRLDARKLLRNSWLLESSKKKKTRRKYHPSDDYPVSKPTPKEVETLFFSGSKSYRRKSPVTCAPKHFSSSGEQSSSSSTVQPILQSCNKVVECKSSVNLEASKNIEVVSEVDDVEMTDISQHVPNLDDSIEPMKIDEYLGNEETLMYTHIVLDTNFLLSHLKYIDILKDKTFDGCGPPVIFIPWVVIQELDKIKQKRNENALCGKASEAIRYLYNKFYSKHPRFRGQSSKMAAKDQPGYHSDCNDDKILQCCEQLFEVLPREKVMLLTEDKNLINKAYINDIFAYTHESLQELLAKYPDVKAPAAATLIEKEPDTESAMKIFLDGIACEVKCQLKSLLENVVASEFEKVYDSLWTKIIIVTPPWTLLDLLRCIKHHWIAVFNFLFSNEMKIHCERLQEMLKKSKGFISEKCDMMNMFACAEVICQEVMKRKKSAAKPVLSEINKLKLVCELHFQKNNSNQADKSPCSKPRASPASPGGTALPVFQYVWKIIDHFTSLILDCCDVQPGISSAKPHQLRTDIVTFLPRFYRCVGELRRCMLEVLEDVSNDAHVQQLHICLVNFVPSLKTDISPLDTENFTAENLVAFCRDGENRELLENGFVQLDNFFQSLDQCITKNGSLIIRGTNGVL